jgi:hypothetical protein
MPHTFRMLSRSALDCGADPWADPLVRTGPPGPALRQRNQLDLAACKLARGPAADQGGRPQFTQTGCVRKACGIGLFRLPSGPRRLCQRTASRLSRIGTLRLGEDIGVAETKFGRIGQLAPSCQAMNKPNDSGVDASALVCELSCKSLSPYPCPDRYLPNIRR